MALESINDFRAQMMETFYGYQRSTMMEDEEEEKTQLPTAPKTVRYVSTTNMTTYSDGSSSIYDMNDLPYMSQCRSMLLLLCAIMFFVAACVYMPLGNIQADHSGNCLLDSTLNFYKESEKNPNTSVSNSGRDKTIVRLNTLGSTYGAKYLCDLTTFTPVMVAILSMIVAWSTFTVWPTMMEIGKGGVLMLVYIFISTLCLIACVVSTVFLIGGYKKTCDNMQDGYKCGSFAEKEIIIKSADEALNVKDFNRAMLIAEVASVTLIVLSSLEILLALITFGIIWFHFHFITLNLSDEELSADSDDGADDKR